MSRLRPPRVLVTVLGLGLACGSQQSPRGGSDPDSEDETDEPTPEVRPKRDAAPRDTAAPAPAGDAGTDGTPLSSGGPDAATATEDGGGDVTATSLDALGPPPPPLAGTLPRPNMGWPNGKCHPTVPTLTPDKLIVPLRMGPGKLMLGASAAGDQRLPFDVDMIRFYDRSLTMELVAAHWKDRNFEPCTAANGCVMEFDFEQIEGTTVKETGPHGMHATLGAKDGAPLLARDGVRGKSVRFGRVWLEVPHHAHMERLANGFSFEIWIRRDWDGKACHPDAYDGNPPNERCKMLRMFEKGSPQFRLDLHYGLRLAVTASQGGFGITHGGEHTVLPKNSWIHYVTIYDRRRGVFFFENGQLKVGCFPGTPAN